MNTIYVGMAVSDGIYCIFKSKTEPTRETHGDKYCFAIGPFRTLRAAEFFAQYGKGNPHLQTVEDAERIVKAAQQKTRR